MSDSQDWLEIKLETNDAYDSEKLEEALFAAGALSVTLTSKADEAMLIEPSPGELPLWKKGIIVTGLFDKGFDSNDAMPILRACLDCETLPLVAEQSLSDRVWELEWTKYFQPIQFGQHLWICPSNQVIPSDKLTANSQIITLDPGLAFGTGTHQTTAMVLEFIATHNVKGKQVIDYGCGSGVLGIAAVKMGAKQCLMTDIDAQALTTTKENASINHVSPSIACYQPEDMPNIQTDLLIANILLEPLLQLKSTFLAFCHADTSIVLTGLLNEQVAQIIDHYQPNFHDFEVTSQGDWAMVTANFSSLR